MIIDGPNSNVLETMHLNGGDQQRAPCRCALLVRVQANPINRAVCLCFFVLFFRPKHPLGPQLATGKWATAGCVQSQKRAWHIVQVVKPVELPCDIFTNQLEAIAMREKQHRATQSDSNRMQITVGKDRQ